MLTPAFATTLGQEAAPAVSLSFDPISSFTPANADPKLAAALGRQGSVADRFQIHAGSGQGPSVAGPGRDSRPAPLRADAARPTTQCRDRAVNALAPTTYNLGVAVGWRRFAVSGDVAKVKRRRSGARRPRKRDRRRQLFAQQALHRPSRGRRRAADGHPRRRRFAAATMYSLDARRLLFAVAAHRADRRRPLQCRARPLSALQDDRRDSQAVYVGTAFKF